MNRTLVSLVPAAVLALSLTACGGDDTDDATDSPSPETSSSATESDPATPDDSDSEDAGESEESESADDPAAQYTSLITTLFSQQPPDGGYASAKEFNEGSDFPDGVSIGSFDRTSQQACIQDENNDIAFSITADGNEPAFVLLDGLCKGGTEVSRLEPDPDDPNEVQVKGDQEIGEAARDALEERFGG